MDIEHFPLKGLQPGHVYFVSQEINMRGIDYRSENGIELLICNPLSNERAYIQALGRVGRYGEPCGRWILEGVPSISSVKEQETRMRLAKQVGLLKEKAK